MLYGVDIFSGAGGLSLGAELAGIKIAHAVEINPSAVKTFLRNHNGAKVHQGDIRNIKASDLENKDNPIFVIMGGPPCQGFSMSNTRTRNMENPKNFLFLEFVRLVREIRPTWFVLENVWGITNIDDGKTKELIKECFEALGYKVQSGVLCASDYGVPQKRHRFFMVGNKDGIEFQFPRKFDYEVTVDEAISDLPSLDNGEMLDEANYSIPFDKSSRYARKMRRKSKIATQNYVSRNNDLVIERYRHIPQGGNWRDIPDELMQNYADKGRCHSGIYKRLIGNQPSVVISNYRKSMLIHPYQNRGLSVREAARLQSFPDDFFFEGPISHIQQQIGNAVPPLLAKAVFEQVIKLSNRQNKHE